MSTSAASSKAEPSAQVNATDRHSVQVSRPRASVRWPAGMTRPTKPGHVSANPSLPVWLGADREVGKAVSGAWTVEEKRAIIAEYESARHGEKGLVLARHGVSGDRLRAHEFYVVIDLFSRRSLTRRAFRVELPEAENGPVGRFPTSSRSP